MVSEALHSSMNQAQVTLINLLFFPRIKSSDRIVKGITLVVSSSSGSLKGQAGTLPRCSVWVLNEPSSNT